VWKSLETSDCIVEPNYQVIEELFAQKEIKKAKSQEPKKAASTEVKECFMYPFL